MKEAQTFSRRPAQGRDLAGYAARCGDIADGDSVIRFGCGTSLADVHYHCAHCVEAPEEATAADADMELVGDAEEERHYRDPG